jgi:hypothetical protein
MPFAEDRQRCGPIVLSGPPPGGYTFCVTTRRGHRPRILIAHRDSAWVDQAKQRLEQMGYSVTECLEPDWVPDLLTGSRPYTLAAVTSEMDPMAQAEILKLVRQQAGGTKIMMLLDQLDSATMHFRGNANILTHRISSDNVAEFALAVAAQVGVPERKPDV